MAFLPLVVLLFMLRITPIHSFTYYYDTSCQTGGQMQPMNRAMIEAQLLASRAIERLEEMTKVEAPGTAPDIYHERFFEHLFKQKSSHVETTDVVLGMFSSA